MTASGINVPKYVRCPGCSEISYIDELLHVSLDVSRERSKENTIVTISMECGCDFCGNVWTIKEFMRDEFPGFSERDSD